MTSSSHLHHPVADNQKTDILRRQAIAAGNMFEIREDDLSGPQTRELVKLHLQGMNAHSPAAGVFALDLDELKAPQVTVWSAWLGDRIAAIGALKLLDDGTAEVKSMRTHPDFVRRGAGKAILATIIDSARARGINRVSLETGTGAAFDPALSLYRNRGFLNGSSFGAYEKSDFNQFLHLDLE